MINDFMSSKKLQSILEKVSSSKISEIENFYGIRFDDNDIASKMKISLLRNYAQHKRNISNMMNKRKLVDYKTKKKQELEEQRYRNEEDLLKKNLEGQAILEKAKFQALDKLLTKFAETIKVGTEKQLENVVKEVQQTYKQISPETKQKLLPAHITYTNCVRRHDPTDEYPAGRPGPDDCIMTYPSEEGIKMRCLIGYKSQNPGDKGFARLKYQIFHEELLKEGDCPKPLSRSVSRRIPGLSWVFVKKDVCDLAKGEEVILGYGNES